MSGKKILAIVTMASAICVQNACAETIHFTPGPYGGTKIITPWGDYVAVPLGGSVWVGTVQDWNNVKADAIANENGLKRAQIAGSKPNERTYVSADGRNLTVGNTQLYAITTSIDFEAPKEKRASRSSAPDGSGRVSIVWNQSNGAPVRASLLANEKGVMPTRCSRADAFFYCEFVASKDQMTSASSLIFYIKNQPPVLVPLASLAKEAHEGLMIKYRRMQGEPISNDDFSSFEALHRLDPEIPDAAGSLPDAPKPSSLTLRICRQRSGLDARDNEKVELVSPLVFSPTTKSQRFRTDKLEYTVFLNGQTLASADSCFVALAKLTKNTARAAPLEVGDALWSFDSLGWVKTSRDPISITLDAVAIEPRQ